MKNRIIGYLVIILIIFLLQWLVKICGLEIVVICILAVIIKNMISDLWEHK
jgi:hypothetical protein